MGHALMFAAMLVVKYVRAAAEMETWWESVSELKSVSRTTGKAADTNVEEQRALRSPQQPRRLTDQHVWSMITNKLAKCLLTSQLDNDLPASVQIILLFLRVSDHLISVVSADIPKLMVQVEFQHGCRGDEVMCVLTWHVADCSQGEQQQEEHVGGDQSADRELEDTQSHVTDIP